MSRIEELGWTEHFAEAFKASNLEDKQPARVVEESRAKYRVVAETDEFLCEVSGRFRHERADELGFPAVGDWVLIDEHGDTDAGVRIHEILPRHSKISRKAAGTATREQIVASNIDTLIFVVSLDDNFSLRRIERYLTVGWNSGATPVLVLNKADICEDTAEALAEAEQAAIGVQIHAVSAMEDGDITETLSDYLKPHRTIALVGSSGVGKSTLLNRLANEELQATQDVRDSDHKGRHTTTRRQLFTISTGTHIIDTPGMREFGVWDTGGLDTSFADISELSAGCRYRDCTHENEPGCAVRAAIDEGELASERLESFHRLQREERYIESKQDVLKQQQQKREIRSIHKELRRHYRNHGDQ